MSEADRLYRYNEIFAGRRLVTRDELLHKFEISPATLKRDLAKLRDQMNVPIVFDRDAGGYRLDSASGLVELPGVRFSPQELLALLTVHNLLDQLQPGLLGPKLAPLRERLNDMLRKQGLEPDRVTERVRVVHAGKRQVPPQCFEVVAQATLERKRLRIVHHNRQRDERTERDISPQQLVHYRDNWYVDARCHLRRDIRCFGIDAIDSAVLLEQDADEVDTRELRSAMSASYGIFGGAPKDWAKIRFSRQRALWVRHEQWHPEQRQRLNEDGTLDLELPYSDEREMLGDVLRFGPDAQVLGPVSLKRQHRALVSRMLDAAP